MSASSVRSLYVAAGSRLGADVHDLLANKLSDPECYDTAEKRIRHGRTKLSV